MNKIFIVPTFIMLFNSSIAQLPSSPRSIEAISRHTSALLHHADSVGLRLGDPVFIRIFKESKELEVWIKRDRHYFLFKTYSVCYYSGSLGPKTMLVTIRLRRDFTKSSRPH